MNGQRGAVPRGDAGAALILAFGILLVVVLMASAAVVFIDFQAGFADKLIKNTQNYYLAEAGYVAAVKKILDAEVKGQDPITVSPVTFTETIGGITKTITVTITLRGVTTGGTNQYNLKSRVE